MSTHTFKPDDLALLVLPKTDLHYQTAMGRPVRLVRKLDPMSLGYQAHRERWYFEFVDGKFIKGKNVPYMSIPTTCLKPYTHYPAPARPVPKGLPDL